MADAADQAPALLGAVLTFGLLLSLALLGLAIYEAQRVWRNRPENLDLTHLILSPNYRLSTAAMLIGIASTAIFLLIGSPVYTITLQNMVQSAIGMGTLPTASGVIVLAVLAGMLISTLQRGSFRLDWRLQWSWLRNVFGGALMGLGTAMVPGGNAVLVLYATPSFSPHALPGLVALLVGAGLLAMKRILGLDTRVVCRNDIYRAELQPAGSMLNSHPPCAHR